MAGVEPTHRADVFDKRAVGQSQTVEEFALHLLYRELEFLPFGRRFRRRKGKLSGVVNNSFIKGHQHVVLGVIYLSDSRQDILQLISLRILHRHLVCALHRRKHS